MVTIQNMEVSFEVEGEGDDAVFAKLFKEYIKKWSQNETETKDRNRRLESECALIDRYRQDGEI